MNQWIQGVPSVERVAAHHKEHGGWWIERFESSAPGFVFLDGETPVQNWRRAVPFYASSPRYFPVGVDGLPIEAAVDLPDPKITWADVVREMDALGDFASIEKRAAWLGRRMLEALATSYCSYCGKAEHMRGLTDEQRSAAMLEHVLTCPKRPELKLVNVALAAEYVRDAFLNDSPSEVGRALDMLSAELDKLKAQPGMSQ